MSWLSNLFGGTQPAPSPELLAAAAQRSADWERSLNGGGLPGFVTQRLAEAGHGKTPWMSTMSPAELLMCRRHGITPVAMVSGTCWYHYGYSWTNGHAEGWHAALSRMTQEAVAAGANAVVDVKMRTIRLPIETSMDYTVVGTAVKIAGLPPSTAPVIATVPAVEFVRLLEAGIVPTGIAIGAHYEWLTARSTNPTGKATFVNQQLPELTRFWDQVRRAALQNLRHDTARLGNGVMAHTHFGQLFKNESSDENKPPQFLGRFIAIGTAVQCNPKDKLPHGIHTVVDMRDGESPLLNERPHGHTAYPVHNDEEGSI